MNLRAAALAACPLLLAAGCGDRDEPDDSILRAEPVSDPFAAVDADAPLAGPGAGITSELPVDSVDPIDPTNGAAAGVNDSVPGPESPRDDGVQVANGVGGELGGTYLAPVFVPGGTFGVAGLYDASVRRPLGTDVRYLYITPDGILIVYDYDLDPYGTGLDCYRDGRASPPVSDPGRKRGDDYLVDGRSVRIVRETLGIGYGFTDTLDDDRDGNATECPYHRYPRVTGLSAIDFGLCR